MIRRQYSHHTTFIFQNISKAIATKNGIAQIKSIMIYLMILGLKRKMVIITHKINM